MPMFGILTKVDAGGDNHGLNRLFPPPSLPEKPMKFSTKTGLPQSLSTDALILGVFEKGSQPAITSVADKAANGLIGRLQKQGDFTGKTGTTLVVHHPEGLKAERLVL